MAEPDPKDKSKSSGDAGKGKKKEGSGRPPGSQSPTAKRQAKRREERLELIRQQVEEGTLTIRQMTPEERKKNPPKPRKKRK